MAFRPLRTIFGHAISLTLISGGSVYVVIQDSHGTAFDMLHPSFKLFGGLFFIGALVLGLSGAFRPMVTVSACVWNGTDLNASPVREQLQRLVVFVAEIYAALIGLMLTGFLTPGS